MIVCVQQRCAVFQSSAGRLSVESPSVKAVALGRILSDSLRAAVSRVFFSFFFFFFFFFFQSSATRLSVDSSWSVKAVTLVQFLSDSLRAAAVSSLSEQCWATVG